MQLILTITAMIAALSAAHPAQSFNQTQSLGPPKDTDCSCPEGCEILLAYDPCAGCVKYHATHKTVRFSHIKKPFSIIIPLESVLKRNPSIV